MQQLPKRVEIIEVCPRDGFQAEREWIPTDRKIEVLNALSRTGVREIQATSFVHPKAVPQLQDAEEVVKGMDRAPGVFYQALVPNLKGLQRALACGLDGVHFMMSVTESHSRANGNRTIEEGMREVREMVRVARDAGVEVEGGLACVFGCPFEGDVPREQLDRVLRQYMDAGVAAFNLGDTIGVADPRQVYEVCVWLLDSYQSVRWTLHLHDTRGMALANVVAAVQAGFTRFDGAVGGLGGCPYAPGATGNVATEDMVNMLHAMGVETSVDLDALMGVAERLKAIVPHPLESHMMRAGRRVHRAAPVEQRKIG